MLDGEGARIVEEAGAGMTCPAGDGRALAEAVLRMAHLDLRARAEMGNQARAYSLAHFDREQIFRRLETLMVEAAGRRQLPTRAQL